MSSTEGIFVLPGRPPGWGIDYKAVKQVPGETGLAGVLQRSQRFRKPGSGA